MRFLITGGAGFIGSNLVEELLKAGSSVRVLDNFSTGKRDNLAPFMNDIELVEGDIRSYHLVRKATQDIDVVLHQAALPSVPRSINDPITSDEVNVAGTLNILEASREAGVWKVVYASSSSVYGDNPQLPKNEQMTPNPLSPYAVSKLAGENYCRVYSRIYGLKTIALRYFNVFGPRQDPHSQYSAVIPLFISRVLKGDRPIIYGDGEQSRDFTYVANVVEANMLAAVSDCPGGQAMNCACGERTSLNQLVEKIGQLAGREIEPVYREPRPGDIKHSLADISLAESAIRYKPNLSFRKGIQLTMESLETTASRAAVPAEADAA